MSELIDRYATIDAIPAPTDADEAEYYGKICDAIEAIPTIKAEPVKHGRWIIDKGDMWCSECGYEDVTENGEPEDYHYCPNCGCCMKEDINNG